MLGTNQLLEVKGGKMREIFERGANYYWFIFRVVFGFLFFVHGAQKLFGWFTTRDTVQLVSLFGLAGVIEVIVGILLVIGLWTRYASLLGIIDMVGAYFIVHMKTAILPWANGGELALLYLVAFLAIIAKGAGIWAIDKEE